jgi:hypothetical protein
MPHVRHWIVKIMIWKNMIGVIRIAFPAKQMKARIGKYSIHTAARF